MEEGMLGNFFALYTDIPLPFDLKSIVEEVLLIDNLSVFILFFMLYISLYLYACFRRTIVFYTDFPIH